jgi:hypothetical protein
MPRCVLQAPDVWCFIYTKTRAKRNPAFAGLLVRRSPWLPTATHTGLVQQRLQSGTLSYLHSFLSPEREGLRPPVVYLTLTTAIPILASACLRSMNAVALAFDWQWYSYHCEPYLYFTMKTLRLISFMLFSREFKKSSRFRGRVPVYLTGSLSCSGLADCR